MGVSDALINFGCSAEELSDSLMKAAECLGKYSHAEGVGSLPCRQTTNVILFSIFRKPMWRFNTEKEATLTVDGAKWAAESTGDIFGLRVDIDGNGVPNSDIGDIVFYQQ